MHTSTSTPASDFGRSRASSELRTARDDNTPDPPQPGDSFVNFQAMLQDMQAREAPSDCSSKSSNLSFFCRATCTRGSASPDVPPWQNIPVHVQVIDSSKTPDMFEGE